MAKPSFSYHLTSEFWRVFQQAVDKHFCELNESEKEKLILQFTVILNKSFELDNKGDVSSICLKKIVKGFKKDAEERKLSLDMLELTLRVLKAETGIDSPNIPVFTELNRDKPILTPERFVKAGLAQDLYELLESEQGSPSHDLSAESLLGRMALWLMLKEGVLDKKMLLAMLAPIFDNEKTGWRQYDHYLYFQFDQKRLIVSKATELFLYHYWFNQQKAEKKPKFFLKYINNYLVEKALIGKGKKLSFAGIRLAYKIESVLTFNPVFHQISSSALKHTLLSESTFLRVISSKYLKQTKNVHDHTKITKRQHNAWSTILSNNKDGIIKTRDCPVAENLMLIEQALEPINAKNIKEVKLGEYRKQLGAWLEDKSSARLYPYVWLIKSWLFKLFFYGGAKKSKIRNKTVIDYVNTLAKPFLAEFSSTNASKLTLDQWIDKLNSVAEQIRSAQRRSYVYYFAEFLVDSGILPDLPLEELDSHSYKGRVDANLITVANAEHILDKLSEVESEVTTIARILLNFGFYSGIRRCEIGFAKIKDFKFGESYCQFHVRLNQHRLLKSPNSARNIPLEVFWSGEEIKFLQDYISRRKSGGANDNSRLFSDKQLLEKAFTLVTQLLQQVTGDESMRFHHLRHSFANWTWFLLNWHYPEAVSVSINCLAHPYFSSERRNQLLARLGLPKGASRKKLFALTHLLGHGDINTTLASYLHTMDLFVYLEKNRTQDDLSKLAQHVFGYGVSLENYYPFNIVGAKNLAAEFISINAPAQANALTRFCLHDAEIRKVIAPKTTITVQKLTVKKLNSLLIQLSKNESDEKAANDQGLSIEIVKHIRQVCSSISRSYPIKSKTKLPVFPTLGLKPYQIRVINSLCKRYDELLVKPNLHQSLKCMERLSAGKDFMIRSPNHQDIGKLLQLLSALNFTDTHLSFTWFLPVLNQREKTLYLELTKAVEAVARWQAMIQSTLGFKNSPLKIVLPKKCSYSEGNFTNFGYVVRSDEGIYLGKSDFGVVAINVKRLKTQSRRSQNTYRPQRDYSLIAFLHTLLAHKAISKDLGFYQ